jgi:hypothetical protein
MKKILLSVAAVACLASAMPALAKSNSSPQSAPSTIVLNGACLGDVGAPTVLGCIGYYDKNLLNSEKADEQKAALAQLGFDTSGFNFNSFTKIPSLNGSATADFGTKLYGITYVGFHFGGGSDAGNVTAFYKIDAGSLGVQAITLLEKASSGAVLYSTGNAPPPPPVPEPATWALLISGFGLIGAAARRRKRVTAFA